MRLLAPVSGGRGRLTARRGAANVPNRHGARSELQTDAGMGNVNPGKSFMFHPNCIKYSAKPLFYTCKRSFSNLEANDLGGKGTTMEAGFGNVVDKC